ncbi:FecR family protein [Ancylobacter aquaticus]|uniref:FecR family protein n=1 Tax=Ancylobacter aquaticus TaxID=100 RepID=A0A4R1I9F4_ANCAQ|nr:FecR family protein [Ancylobacter aquaticus]TCK30881.1 FecR family protein [Ancylobacter aquaticus]
MSLHEVAADWLIRVREAPGDAALARSLTQWLDEHDAHRRAYASVQRSWQLLAEVPAASAELRAHDREDATPALIVAFPRRLWRPLGICAALAAGLMAFLAYPALVLLMEADYRTGTGARQTLALEDGSRIELGAESAVAVDVTGATRIVRLLAGEAFFDVRSDPSRPFIVDAGGVDVTVLGTRFNVRLTSTDAGVELADGAVGLTYPGHGTAQTRLVPGQSALVDLRTGTLVTGEIAVDDIAVWREGRLFVQDATIAAVVEQLQRYHRAWITVPDSALAQQRVTGLYDLTDPDRALRALVEPHGGRMREISPYMRVLSRF